MSMRPACKTSLLLTFLTSVVLLAGLAACGGRDDGGSPGPGASELKNATLVLDFIPGAIHAGIYEAKKAGYYEDNGIDLTIIEPTSTADTLKLIDAGKADFGLADGIDLAGQIEQGRQAQGIMAVTQRPSGGLITLEKNGIDTPADLSRESIGVTGVPSDNAVLDTILGHAGLTEEDVKVITIGFNGVQALESGKIQGFIGFIPADGTQLEADGYPTRSFPFDEYGGPSYPGLVIFSTEAKIDGEPDLMRGFVEATVKGYRAALDDPATAIDDLISQTQGINKGLATKSFDAWKPLLGPADTYGQFDQGNLEALSSFLVESDLASRPISPGRYATNRFSGGSELAAGK